MARDFLRELDTSLAISSLGWMTTQLLQEPSLPNTHPVHVFLCTKCLHNLVRGKRSHKARNCDSGGRSENSEKATRKELKRVTFSHVFLSLFSCFFAAFSLL